MSTQAAAVSVPATTANLGPGYDCLGAALDWRDVYQARMSDEPGVRVEVRGEGAGRVPHDATNLVAKTLLRCFEHLGTEAPTGLEIVCDNAIAHGRGLGSSSAAIVGGLALGRALSGLTDELPDYALLEFAAELEGHPDNVAPAVYGGFTISWTEWNVGRAIRLDPHPDIVPVLAIAPTSLATEAARSLIPTDVPLADTVFNISRTAMMTQAITADPELLLPATADRLHQERRGPAYPASHAILWHMREHGHAAVISGAGPSVLILAYGDTAAVTADLSRAVTDQWRIEVGSFAPSGVLEVEPTAW